MHARKEILAMNSRLTPFRIQKFLAGLRYPAGKSQVLERARERGADQGVLAALQRLPDRAWESPVALSREVGRPS
jgi:hypothetical protein